MSVSRYRYHAERSIYVMFAMLRVRVHACMHAHMHGTAHISSFLSRVAFWVISVWYDEAAFFPQFFVNSILNFIVDIYTIN